MFESKRVLILGFGQLAKRVAERWPQLEIIGVSRSRRKPPPGVTLLQGTLKNRDIQQAIIQSDIDAVIVSLTPDEMSEDAYRNTYVSNIKALVNLFDSNKKAGEIPSPFILFVSSSSVYGQNDGTWVDECSPTKPASYRGEILLEAENILRNDYPNHAVLRFSGIYGPGRLALVKQVSAGKMGDDAFSNRIHEADCAGIICHLCEQVWQGKLKDKVFIGSDSTPVTNREVRRYIASLLGLDDCAAKAEKNDGVDAVRGGNKRCSNERVRRSGYTFLYPSYREGYRDILSS